MRSCALVSELAVIAFLQRVEQVRRRVQLAVVLDLFVTLDLDLAAVLEREHVGRVLQVFFLDEHALERFRIEAERRAQLQTSSEASLDQIRQLMLLKGIGINGSWLLVMEFFGWRAFKNRREVGGLAGLTPTPYQSGESAREQGITKSGNPHVRWMITELAWSWLRFQPESALSVWFRERFGDGGKRLRRIGIVAVSRKLLIALWRFLERGVLPEGAVLKEG